MFAVVYAVLMTATDANAHTAPVHAPVILTEHPRGCPHEYGFEVAGCAYSPDQHGVSRVYVRDLRDHEVVQHELGHVYDATSLRPRYREAMRLLLRAEVWHGGTPGEPDGAELFADAYSRCATHLWGGATVYGYAPSRVQHRAACRLIWLNDRDRNE